MSAQPLSVHELADQCGLALLYHGTFASPPAVLGKALHNVAPETLFSPPGSVVALIPVCLS